MLTAEFTTAFLFSFKAAHMKTNVTKRLVVEDIQFVRRGADPLWYCSIITNPDSVDFRD